MTDGLPKPTVTHEPDTEDDTRIIEIVGDSNSVEKEFFEDLKSGAMDKFSKSADELRLYKGLSEASKRRVYRKFKKFAEGHDDVGTKSKVDKQITGYGVFDVVQPPYNLDYLAKLYDISSAHRAAVDAKVTNIVGLGYEFNNSPRTEEHLQDAAEGKLDLNNLRRRIERARRTMEDWTEDANDEDSFIETMRKIMTDVETMGNGYMEVGRNEAGRISYIGHIHATTMRRRIKKDGYVQIVGREVTFFRNFGGDAPNPLGDDNNPNEIIHFSKYTPISSYYGTPEVLSARNAIAGDEFAARFNLDYFEHKAVPRYIVTLKGAKLSRDSERKIVNFLSSNLKGQHHRTLYIPLPEDQGNNKVEFEMQPVEVKVQESSFTKYHEQNREDVFMAHRVPPSQVGLMSGASMGAVKESARQFKEQVCRPWQDIIEKKLRRLFKEITDAFEIHFVELSLTDEETASRIHERYLRWEVYTPNEVRDWLGEKGLPGGDKTVGVLAQAKERSSASREQSAQANQSRQRDAERSGGPDGATSDRTRGPKGDGRQTE